MILNVIFLAGGICIGYLIRGEIDRKKSKKAWSVALEEGMKVAEKFLEGMNSENNAKEDNDASPDEIEIPFDTIADMFKDATNQSNSSDETIKL